MGNPREKRHLSRLSLWIAAGFLFRFGMDLFAEILLEKKRRKRHVD